MARISYQHEPTTISLTNSFPPAWLVRRVWLVHLSEDLGQQPHGLAKRTENPVTAVSEKCLYRR